MSITFEDLKTIEGAWVDIQLEIGIPESQIATNLGYKLVAQN